MATKIITKNSSTTTAIPTAADLVQGELAVNVTDKRLFTENSAGAIVEVGTNPSTLTVTGAATFSGEITANGGIDVTGTATMDGLTVEAAGFAGMNIQAGTTSVAAIDFGDSADTNIGGINYNNADDTLNLRAGNLNRVTVTSAGNVGIGVSSPSSFISNGNKLVVGDGTVSQGITIYTSTAGDGSLYFADGTTGDAAYRGFLRYSHSTDSMQFYTAGATERLRIDSAGNVGIGTSSITNPYSQSNFTDVNINGVWGAAISFKLGGVTKGWVGQRSSGNEDMVIGATTGQELLFYENNVEAMRISSGNLYVGGTDAAYDGTKLITGSYSAASAGLSILSSSSGVGYLLFGDGTGANGYSGQINYNHNQNRMGFNTNNVEYMAINSAGDLLLNTAVPLVSGKQSILFNGSTHNGLVLKTTRVALNSTFATFINVSGSICGSIIQNGTTTVNYSASSDRRLKENISDSDDSGSVIDAIQVRKFDWIGTDEHERFGFIAQELQEVVPVAVCSMGMADEEDPMLGVDPSKLMALAIKEIQALRARIAILEGA